MSNLPWDYMAHHIASCQLHKITITNHKTIQEMIENHNEKINNRCQSSDYQLIHNLV